MFAYQTAAYRRSKDLASIVAFGSPVDTLAALPMGIPPNLGAVAADFMADHVFNRIDIQGWMARTGFQMLDPLKTAKARVDFLRQLHDREALLPREQQRRFLDSEGWIAWSGPAISELLKQFIAHNRMMSGGFAINGQLVTLTDITCPVLAFIGEVDDIGQPASVRGIRRAAPDADVYEAMIRAGHFGLVVGSKARDVTWPTVADWVRWLSGQDADAGQHRADAGPARASTPTSGVCAGLAGDARGRGGLRGGDCAGARRGRSGGRRQQVDAHAGRRDRPHPAAADPARPDQRPHPDLARPHHRPSRPRARPTASSCCSTAGCTPTRRSTAASTTWCAGLIDVGVRQGDHVGVLMETRPSALVAIAALSRLGAVAVLMPPDGDLAEAARLGRRRRDHHRPDQSRGRAASCRCRCWSSAAAKPAICTCPTTPTSSTWSRSTRTPSSCRAGTGPTPDSPATWRSSRSARSAANWSPSRSPTTAGRCRRSAPHRPRRWAAATPSTA